jgi:hypothetical protein
MEKTEKNGEVTKEKALQDFSLAYDYKKKFLDAADEDVRFTLGRQWDTDDVEALKKVGVRALTINKIRPNINLLKGIESQNRSEIKCYPEGQEDSVEAEIATSLLKNVMKNAEGDYKTSEQFEDGNIVGEGWLEPYLDYSENILFPKLKFRKGDYWNYFWDPDAKEYDLSDGKHFCKVTFDLVYDQILSLFPDKKDILEGMAEGGKIKIDKFNGQMGAPIIIDRKGYSQGTDVQSNYQSEARYDLLEYYYKRYVDVWYLADLKMGGLKKATSEEEAKNYAKITNEQDAARGEKESVKLLHRIEPEIWCKAICGNEELSDERSWSFPRWKTWPFINYFAYKSSLPLGEDDRDLSVQGITRQAKDLNRELNKRRTQSLRHLNQSANSGWLTPKGAWVDPDKVEKFGSTPGVNLEWDPAKSGGNKPERISPSQLSMGHEHLAQENAQDIKDTSGINTDLLAMTEGGQSSGRAIAIRQKQGLTMVQGLFDNLSRTKRMMGKFILSQLSQVYDMDRAMRVMGDAFIQKNFSKPSLRPMINPQTGQPVIDPSTGQPAMQPAINPQTGQPVMEIDKKAAVQLMNQVLNDAEIGNYDVAIGENVANETIAYGVFLELKDMAASGMPIPPDVLIDASPISNSIKEKIKAAFEAQQAAAMNAPGGPAPKK